MHKLSCYLCIQVRHFVDSRFCCLHSVDMFALDPCHVNVCGRTLLVLSGLVADHVTISRRSRHVTRPISGSTVIISRRIMVQDNLFGPKWLFEVSAHKQKESEWTRVQFGESTSWDYFAPLRRNPISFLLPCPYTVNYEHDNSKDYCVISTNIVCIELYTHTRAPFTYNKFHHCKKTLLTVTGRVV